MTLQQLQQKLKEKSAKMKKIVADNPETMDEETEKEFDQLASEVKNLQASIKRMESVEGLPDLEEGTGRQTSQNAPKTGSAKPRQPDEEHGFQSMGEFSRCVVSASAGGSIDQRLQFFGAPGNVHVEGGSTDGWMVPPAYSSKMFELAFGEPDLLGMVDVEPTASNSVQMLADESTPWGTTGIQAYWVGEAKKFTPSRLETEGKEVKLNKLYAYVEAGEELIEDGPRLNARLTKDTPKAINWKANEAILYGNGVGRPLGFDKSSSKITVAKESGQAAATLNATNIAKMFSRSLNPGGSVWMINPDVLPQLMLMTIGNQPIWTAPSEGFKNAPGGYLLGRPILFSEQCKTLGTNGDIQFIDPMGYYMPQKAGGVKFASSMHLYFDYDVQAFKWTFRIGGMPYLNAAVSPKNGSNTKSHYVTLATRA